MSFVSVLVIGKPQVRRVRCECYEASLFLLGRVSLTLRLACFFVCVIMLSVSRRPSVTLCTDRRTHASRRGLSEGGVALRGCALLLSFPVFPPSRPSSPPVLRPNPALTYRLQVFLCYILRHLFPTFSLPCNPLLRFISASSLSFITVFLL